MTKAGVFSNSRRNQRGLTLLELLVVIMILGLLSVVAAVQLTGYFGRAKRDTVKLQIDQLDLALDLFHLDMDRFPSTNEGLRVLLERPANAKKWRGPYLKKREAIDDPWGRRFIFKSPGKEKPYELTSYGADGLSGGEGENADITNQ